MRRKLAIVCLCLSVLGTAPLFGEEGIKHPVEVTSTERFSFGEGGVIRVNQSYGYLNVEGWDQPTVEITVTRSMERYYEPGQQDQAARRLERVRVVAERRSDSELTISTVLPRKFFARWLGSKSGLPRGAGATLDKVTGTVRHPLGGKGAVKLEYQIHVPHNSRLVIQHGPGQVLVGNVSGDIDVASSSGDIVLMLTDSGTYSIDARSKLGTVSSDFPGSSHRRHLVGSGFARPTPPPSRRIHLRTGIGGITIKAVPAEADMRAGIAPSTDHWRTIFVYRPEVGALEAISVVHEPRIQIEMESQGPSLDLMPSERCGLLVETSIGFHGEFGAIVPCAGGAHQPDDR